MKGLFVINSLSGGGAEKVFTQLIEMIEKDVHKQYYFEVVILDNDQEIYQFPSSITVHRLGQQGGIVAQIFRFLKLVKKVQPDFVLSFLFRSNWYNAIGSKIFGYTSLLSERGNTNARLIGSFKPLKKALIKRVFHAGDATICVSNGVGQCLIDDYQLATDKVEVLNNFYNLHKIDSASTETVVEQSGYILAIGRLVKLKGFDDLITAYANSGIERELWFLGDGPELAHLRAYADKMGVGNQVKFLGFINNPYPYMRNAHCFALTSHFEGFPNAMVEAMSLSIPVVASLTDGPIDILEPKNQLDRGEYQQAEYGLTFTPGDIPALTRALIDIDTDGELHANLSLLSKQRAEFYSEDKFYSSFNTILKTKVACSHGY